ncbi:MAG: ABC transporter ATP-binding protein [Gemmatimonadetes bacterium]|nr:ABC transporter ATP-binding protein [Gemmatimonadota bacterium]
MNHLRSVLPYFRPYRARVAWGMVLVVIANAFALAGPYLLKLAVDALSEPGVTRRDLLTYALLIVAAAIVGGAARYGMRELLNGVSRRIEVDLRQDFLSHLLRLDAGFYNHTRTGDLMSRATNDTLAVRQAVGPAVMYSANTVVNFTLGLALMLWISPRLTLVSLVPMLLLPPIVILFGRVIHRRFEQIQEQFSTLSTMVQENLSGVRIVRAYQQEAAQAGDFEALNEEYLRRNMQLAYASGAFHPTLGLLTGFAMVAVLWDGGQQIMSGAITVGDFIAFNFYLALLIWPMIALGWVVNLFQRGSASMGRINRFLRAEPRIGAPAHPVEGPTGGVRIEFDDVTFRYPQTERVVLEDISFVAEPGQTVAVVGPTGSGKSTLVSLISRIYDPTEGEVRMNGIALPAYDPADVRRVVGFVPQDTFLFSATLADNIGLGLPPGDGEERDAEVRNASEAAQLHDTILDFPEGYRTMLGERGINLSGGQKQRATLARALAKNPPVIVLDDALSAVDTHTEAKILADLRDQLQNRTAFIISHRVTAVMDADLILVLDEGRIVERGVHADLLAKEGTYATLLHRQLLEQDLSSATA